MDKIEIKVTKKIDGLTIKEYLKTMHVGRGKIEELRVNKCAYLNNEQVNLDTPMKVGDVLTFLIQEKIDVIPYVNDDAKFIENALSPAKDLHIFVMDEKKKQALAIVNQENLSLAIGRKGLNVRLASRLTHFNIDVETIEQAREHGISIVE